MIEIVEETVTLPSGVFNGFRINVWLADKIQRTAWMRDKSSALRVATEFAEYYGKSNQPLPINKPW